MENETEIHIYNVQIGQGKIKNKNNIQCNFILLQKLSALIQYQEMYRISISLLSF